MAQPHPDTSGCHPEFAPGCRANAWDSSVKASGAGSLRFDIRSQTGQGAGGNVVVNFSNDNSVQFGANQEFWLQWRQRFDPYIIDHNYAETSGSGEWKQVIIAQGDRTLADGSVLQGYACSENQLVIENIAGVGLPAGLHRVRPVHELRAGARHQQHAARPSSPGRTPRAAPASSIRATWIPPAACATTRTSG